jgi:hypothetical protein
LVVPLSMYVFLSLFFSLTFSIVVVVSTQVKCTLHQKRGFALIVGIEEKD